jgi:hypothetical protein
MVNNLPIKINSFLNSREPWPDVIESLLIVKVEKKQNNKNIAAWIEYSRPIIGRYLLNMVKVQTLMIEKYQHNSKRYILMES